MAEVHNVKKSTQFKREHKEDYGKEKIKILYSDEYLVVIEKPSGLLSVPYPGSKSRTALGILEKIFQKEGKKVYTVHRLDRDTSGVMMFALSEKAQKKIMDSWHQMVSERLYRAVAENPKKWTLSDAGLIDDELAFNAHNMGFVPKADAKPKKGKSKGVQTLYDKNIIGSGENMKFKTVAARTHYKMLIKGETHTMFELSLDTGKKNQIRAHLASKGFVLAGDENYRAKTDPFHRLALHARTLCFTHPFTKEQMRFEVAEPEEWAEYVKKGDKNPKPPVWQKKNDRNENRDIMNIKAERAFSKKQMAHMDFMERMKAMHRGGR